MNAKFNKENLSAIQQEVLAALRQIEEKHDVKFKFGGGKFTPHHATFKLEVAQKVAASNGELVVETKERSDWNRCCAIYGMLPSDRDMEITIRGEKLITWGILSRAHRSQIILKRVGSGQLVRFDAHHVRLAILEARATSNSVQHAV